MSSVDDYINAKEIFDSIPKIRGEARSVSKCLQCGELYGRQYIPYGLGFGKTFGGCMCIVTGYPSTKQILYHVDVE